METMTSERLFCVGDAIRLLRQRQGYSARGLSNLAGLSPSYVSKVETGEIEPSFRAFARMACILRMTPREIYLCTSQEGGIP